MRNRTFVISLWEKSGGQRLIKAGSFGRAWYFQLPMRSWHRWAKNAK